ncbi:hypothetical protein [Microbulbifer sp. VAAF005]|uniref:hypothetical protein n=1 Tax=Microbulbifer sp. VAAF005 TaxID=3034230 RepID=UPI0024AD24D7|nr:hypothetical protein [Microbulbifer sp. VAAF005]WHI47212.1 hypothetical protein P0078_02215 [Microbulbifer sp. VAAF005]
MQQKILKYCDLKELERHASEVAGRSNYAEMLLNGCEILAANGKDLSSIEPILEYLCPDKWRLVNNIYIHDVLKNDVAFRAYSLLMRHRGLDVKIESYWIDSEIPEDIEEAEKNRKKQKISEKHREIRESLSNLMSVYAARADILLSNILPKDANAKLKSALGSLFENSWRMSREHYFESICSQLSWSVANLSAIPDIDMNTVFALSKACFKDWPSVYSSGQRMVISKLIKIPELSSFVVKDIYQRSVEVKDIKAAASEKISILLDLSRILLFADKNEAREIFKIAVDIANDVDADAMHDVSLFSTLSKNAKNHFSTEISQQTANQMAEIITEYGTLLEGYDHFPWGDAISAIAILDMAKAISLIGYWEDCDLVLAKETLPALISTGLSEATISSSQAASILNFCDDMSGELLTKLVSTANPQSSRQLIEEVARAELLRFNKNGDSKACQALNQLIPYDDDSGYWHSALNQLIQFKEQKREVTKANVDSDKLDPSARKETEKEFLDGINLAEISFESPTDFVGSIKVKKKEARGKKLYIGADDILISASRRLEFKDRITFLNLLADDRVIDGVGYTWAKTLTDCINLWVGSSHAISSWREENLPILIANHLGEFSYNENYGYDKGMLKGVIDSLHLNREETVSLLLDGLEKNAESLPLTKIYSVIRLMADYCSDEQIADVTTRYIRRLSSRLKIPTKATDSECSVESALACQLYSFLGDVDTRVRWRAAHSIRASARVGNFNIIVALTALYDRKSMPGYREDNVPFYWLSARLWLIVTFDRIASETPEAVAPIASWLLDIATDPEFPHVLMRHFAKSCLMKLISGDFIDFDEHEVTAVGSINTSGLDIEKSKRSVSRGGFHKEDRERRFRFDSLDTLNYIYPGAIRCFSDVDQEMFLDEAESWIIDRWKNGSDLSAWENEPRKYKFERSDYNLYSHSHGAMPTIERHSYYLEWHAMWCSIGSLMVEKSLAEAEYDDDDYGTLDVFLRKKSLTQPPHWSSDLRCPTPLENRFHQPPSLEVESWIANIKADDFDLEVGLNPDGSDLFVDSYHSVRTSKHSSTVRISSSLVNPDRGLSLIRALQTSDDSHDYRLPPTNHESEIDEGPYLLRGWISEPSGDSRLDEKDTFNHGVRMIEGMPAEEVVKMLGLRRSKNYPVSWVDSEANTIFTYEAWGDVIEYSRQKEYIHGDDVVSDGHRLKISSHHLEKYLNEVNLDLILEVEITRRASKDGITGYNEEPKKEARYARLYLFRRTGEIVTTEGCFGTWSPSGD